MPEVDAGRILQLTCRKYVVPWIEPSLFTMETCEEAFLEHWGEQIGTQILAELDTVIDEKRIDAGT